MRKILTAILLTAMAGTVVAGQNRWTESSPVTVFVAHVVADPGDPATAYALTPIGYYRTTDAGTTWKSVDAAFPSQSALLIIDQNSVLWLAAGATLYSSSDRGDHWTSVNVFQAPILAIAAGAGTVYCATNTQIWSSADGGGTWIQSQLPDSSGPVLELVATSRAVYALTAPTLSGVAGQSAVRGSSLRTTDGGRTWQKIDQDGATLYGSPASDKLYKRSGDSLYVSSNLGNSWSRLPGIPGGMMTSVAIDGANVYAGNASDIDGGIFLLRSSSWSKIGPAITVSNFAVSQDNLYVAGSAGVVTLGHDRASWTEGNGLPGAAAQRVAVADSDPSRVYASVYYSDWYRSADGGNTWSHMNVNAAPNEDIAISPLSADTAYLPDVAGSIVKTTDGGITWKKIRTSGATALAIAPSNPSTIYASYADSFARSTDNGVSWTDVTKIPAGFFYGYGYTYAPFLFVVDPKNDSTIVAVGGAGLDRTTDGAQSWQPISSLSLNALVFDPGDSSTLYGIDIYGRVLRGMDQGRDWSSAGLVDRSATAIAAGGSRVCADTKGGIYCMEHGGPWTGLVDGDQHVTGNRITIDASGTHLVRATYFGVWQYEIAGDDIAPQRIDNDPSRLTGALGTHAVVIPIAGTARGSALFTTELAITNAGNAPERVIAVWLPLGGGATQTFQFDVASGSNRIFDIGQRFGTGSIGTLALFTADPNGSIDASARIWMHPANNFAPLFEDVPAATDPPLHMTANASGLRNDSQTRTNIGIANLSAESHAYVAQISGERASHTVTLTVPAFSLVQVGVPDADYGALSINVSADAQSRWVFYGNSIDRATGEAHMTLGR